MTVSPSSSGAHKTILPAAVSIQYVVASSTVHGPGLMSVRGPPTPLRVKSYGADVRACVAGLYSVAFVSPFTPVATVLPAYVVTVASATNAFNPGMYTPR